MSKRLRLVIAPVVTMLLLLQSVMPGALAYQGVTEAPAPNVVVSDDSIATPPSEDDGEDAGEPREPVSLDTGEVDEDAGVGDNSIVEEPIVEPDQTVNEDAQPAASSRSLISPMAVVGPGVTGVTVTPTVLTEVCDPVRADGTWAVDADSRIGDTFTLTFDSRLNVVPGVRDLYAVGMPQTPENLVAKMSVTGNVATFVMQVDGANGGTFFIESSSCWGQIHAGEDVVLTFTGSGGGSWPNTVKVPPAPLAPPATNADKSGSFTGEQTITWRVRFPSGPSAGATITDLALDGWKFDTATFNATNQGGSSVVLVAGSNADSITVTTGEYGNGRPEFTIQATLVDGWEDLGLSVDGQGRTVFSNAFTGTNTGLNGDVVDINGSTTVAKPLPPPVYPLQPNPVKTGAFTRDDQGRTNPNGAIEWTVYFPVGTSGGSTITDTAGDGWTFDLGSFEPINRSGGTVTLDSTSTNGEIKVNVGPYSHETNAPGFRIRATITDPEVTTFKNIATSVSTPVDGGGTIPGSSGEVEVPRTDVPPVSNEPRKSGEFTGDETITWTVHFPAGSSGGATITDAALTGWVFDLDTFNATNRGGSNVVLAEGSTANSISVTSGVYITGNQGPSFTIQATLVDGWENLDLPTDEDGRFVFSNTANVSTIPYGGGEPVTGSVDATAEKPLPPSPPETGTNPSKEGAWTSPGDQGAVTPNGAIKWTVVLPHGPANGAVITDYAGDGWRFDCDTFQADTRWFDSAQVDMTPDCTPERLIVTVGAYGGNEWYVPQFTINADITLTPSHQDGRGFNNTVTSVVTDITGTVTKNGTITTDWLVQQSGFGGDGRTYTIPVTPTVNDAVCVDGVEPNPSVQLPNNAFGLTYSILDDSLITTTGEYSIKATKAETHQWGNLPTGWSIDENNDSVAIFVGQVEIVPCAEPVLPIDPTVTGAVCEDGVNPNPQVVLATTPEGVRYEIVSEVDPVTGDYVVKATITGENLQWDDLSGTGWVVDEEDETVAFYKGNVDIIPCEVVELVLPTVAAAVCEGGVDPDPTQSTVVTGEDTDLVSYEITSPINEAGVYVVTATKDSDAQWPADLGAWVPVEGNPNQLTYTGQVEIVLCDPVIPVAPDVIGNVCEGGFYTPAEAVAADGPEGVTYSELEAEGGRITATATLSDGQKWDISNFVAPGELGWSIDPKDATVAHYIGTYQEAPCAPIIPVNPVVNQAVCTGGELINPVVTVVDTDRIKYTKSGEEVSGGTVVVTATLEDGYEWNIDEMPAGWTVNPEDPSEATFVVELEDIDCTAVVPVIPTIEGNVCLGGVYMDPTIAVNGPEGVVYSNGIAEGGRITITATVEAGYAWDAENMPEGWTIDEKNPGVAHFEGEYEEAPCNPVVPGVVEVTPAVCEGDRVVPPSVELPTTPGVTYTKDGEEVPGGTVVITAELEDGYEWGELPEGWTLVDPTTATFTVTFDTISCEVEKPKEEKPAKVTELPSTGTGAEHAGPGLIMASMAGLMLAAVALRMNAFRRS